MNAFGKDKIIEGVRKIFESFDGEWVTKKKRKHNRGIFKHALFVLQTLGKILIIWH